MNTGKKVFEFSVGSCGISSMDIDESGKRCVYMRNIQVMSHNAIYRIVTGSPNGQLKVWSYNSGECIKTLDKGECSTCNT